MKPYSRQKGFTLVELVVALGIGSAILLGAWEAVFQITRGVDRTSEQLSTLRDASNAANRGLLPPPDPLSRTIAG